mmetsp:Transcript_7987/g.24718  ORF Transcript_7987/g.24718 Transcript_7987/m.24718 type:complete len:141 (-) Transcript_7987:1795-2217(-)
MRAASLLLLVVLAVLVDHMWVYFISHRTHFPTLDNLNLNSNIISNSNILLCITSQVQHLLLQLLNNSSSSNNNSNNNRKQNRKHNSSNNRKHNNENTQHTLLRRMQHSHTHKWAVRSVVVVLAVAVAEVVASCVRHRPVR